MVVLKEARTPTSPTKSSKLFFAHKVDYSRFFLNGGGILPPETQPQYAASAASLAAGAVREELREVRRQLRWTQAARATRPERGDLHSASLGSVGCFFFEDHPEKVWRDSFCEGFVFLFFGNECRFGFVECVPSGFLL